MYSSLEEYLQHVDIDHMMIVWACTRCPTKTGTRIEFTSQSEYMQHMQQMHGLTLTDPSAHRLPRIFKACDLCGSFKEPNEGALHQKEIEAHAWARNCMAKHMKEWALLSLPWHFDDVSQTGSNQAERAPSSDDGSPNTEQDIPNVNLSAENKMFNLIRSTFMSSEAPDHHTRDWVQPTSTHQSLFIVPLQPDPQYVHAGNLIADIASRLSSPSTMTALVGPDGIG